ncbi:MAG: ABC transporter permease [Acidobacteriota bacterium]
MLPDLRYAVRSFVRTPSFTVVAVLTLALGIGTSTAIFSVVNGVLLRPLAYPDAETIVQVWMTSPAEPKSSLAAADFLEFHRDNRTLLRLAGYREEAFTITTATGEPGREGGALVTADYFEVFAMPAALGRTFTRAADGATSEPLVVLSHAVWKDQFASDPQVVGRRVRINSVAHTVTGVMPPAFDYPLGAKAWVLSAKPVPLPPIDVPGDLLENRTVHYFQAVGRLRPAVTREQARTDLGRLADEQARRFPSSNGGRGIALEPVRETIVGDVRSALLVLLGAVGVVLLIACANVASLLLARASGRQRELSIRAALGASRGRLIRQLITESLLLGAAGAIAGLIAGSWALALLLKVMPENIPRVEQIGLDGRVTTAAVLVSFLSAVLFGLAPALQGSRTNASLALRDADRTSTAGRHRATTRSALVVGEIALTLILLVSAGLLANSFVRLQRVDPGFKPDQVSIVMLPLPASKYPDGVRQTTFYRQIVEAMRSHGEVQSAAILFPNPINGGNASGSFTIEGQPVVTRTDRPFAALGSVSEDYFRTLGIPLIEGRSFAAQDRDPAPAVAIANVTLARKYFAGRDPVGVRVRFGDHEKEWITIVGVVADSRNAGLHNLPTPLLYFPYHQFPLAFMSLAIRSTAAPAVVASAIRSEVKRIDPEMPVDRITSLRDLLRDSVAQPRFRTLLLAAFAVMAIVLASVGVYGLMSYSVTQRTREIGIRVALGAQARQVILPVLREGLTLALAGIVVGLAGSLAATRMLGTFLFGVTPTDPLTYAAVVWLLIGVALLATYIPARRALRINPITALRAE